MRNGNGYHKNFVFDKFRLEAELQTLRRDGAEIHLAKRPFQVLFFLIENRERIVSRDELLDKFWDGHDVYDDALRKCVGAIRKALDDFETPPRFVEIRRGSGYRFVGTVFEEDEETEEVGRGGWQLAERANGTDRRTTDTEKTLNDKKQTPKSALINRPVFVGIFALILISLTAFGFYAYRRQNVNSTAQTLAANLSAKRSIAILPIKNLTGDPANDYLADGIAEGLINEISRIETLKVISRSSAFQFKNKDASAQEIGERLGVETILEGGLRQSGDDLRLEVRLVNTKDGSVMWASDSKQKKMADIFAIEDSITCQIVTELKVKLCGEVPPAARYTANVEAYQAYLKGLYFRNRLGADDLKKAVDFFNQALKIDPNYALAHEGLASTYTVMEFNAIVPPGTVAPLAELHATKALELDDSLAGAYIALGAVKTMRNYDLQTRENYYNQALLKNPNHRTAHLWLSNLYTAQGKFEEAEAEILRAQEIDPLSMGVHLTLTELYLYWHKPDKTIEQATLMLVANPDEASWHGYLAMAYAQKGDFETAFAELKKNPPDNLMRAAILAAAGRAGEARKFVEAFANSDEAKNSPFKVAGLYALLGDKETAFAWLEKSYAMRQADLVSIKIEPALDSLRDDARYLDLLRRVHLDDASNVKP